MKEEKIPRIPPIKARAIASEKKSLRMNRLVAPVALRMPTSRFRSLITIEDTRAINGRETKVTEAAATYRSWVVADIWFATVFTSPLD